MKALTPLGILAKNIRYPLHWIFNPWASMDIVIIWSMFSVSLRPKVILFSSFRCSWTIHCNHIFELDFELLWLDIIQNVDWKCKHFWNSFDFQFWALLKPAETWYALCTQYQVTLIPLESLERQFYFDTIFKLYCNFCISSWYVF